MQPCIVRDHFRIQEASQPEHSHPPEVCSRIVALETNVLPLFGDPGLQTDVWHQLRPQLNGTKRRITYAGLYPQICM